MRSIAIVLLLTACPGVHSHTPLPDDDQGFGTEGVDWWWGTPSCSVVVRDDTATAATTTHWRDSRGEVVRLDYLGDDESETTYVRRGYDREGRLVIEDQIGRSTTRYRYDAAGRIVASHMQSSFFADLQTVWEYGDDGHIATRTIEYDTIVEVQRWTWSDDRLVRYWTQDAQGEAELRWTYDDTGRLEQHVVEEWVHGALRIKQVADYTWAGQHIVDVHRYVEPANADRDHYHGYTWDGAGRLIEYVDRDPAQRVQLLVVVEHGLLGIASETAYSPAGLLEQVAFERTPGHVTATFFSSFPHVATVDYDCPPEMPPLPYTISGARLTLPIPGLPSGWETPTRWIERGIAGDDEARVRRAISPQPHGRAAAPYRDSDRGVHRPERAPMQRALRSPASAPPH